MNTETIQTRNEHSRSVGDAEKFRALETLKELGLLVPVSELETFHGRLGSNQESEAWSVDPSFDNSSTDQENVNVHRRPTLYAGEQQVATAFADERANETARTHYTEAFKDRVRNYTPEQRNAWLKRRNKEAQDIWNSYSDEQRRSQKKPEPLTDDDLNRKVALNTEARELEKAASPDEKQEMWERANQEHRAEVHEIVVDDIDAAVIDLEFDVNRLDAAAKERYDEALLALVIPMTEGSPVGFEDRDKVSPFMQAMGDLGMADKPYLLQGDIEALAAKSGVDQQTALQLASAYNSRQIIRTNPGYLVKEFTSNAYDIATAEIKVNGTRQTLPVNLEYVQRYLREAHIVGSKQIVSSTTLGRDVTAISLFDLEKTVTAESLESDRAENWRKLGSIATALGEFMHPEVTQKQPLLKLLEDVYAKPGKLVDAAKLVEGYEGIFNADAGNWEGYTLAEHTETVLRNFDENYADMLPVQMLPVMRLAILVHDLGKPVAAAQRQKERQKEYNLIQADDFMRKLGVNDRLANLLLSIIGDGEELASSIDIQKDGEPAEKAMRELAIKSLTKFNGSEGVSEEQVGAFKEMCSILQICDGGAYTSMAITDRGSQGMHRNAPSFNATFRQPVGLGKRGIQLRGENDPHAPSSLTPTASERQSRLRVNGSGARGTISRYDYVN